LRAAVREFVRTEYEETQMRVALGDAEPLYRDAPEARAHHLAVARRARDFMREALPNVPEPERLVAADVTMMSMAAVGKQVSEAGFAAGAIDARARALGDMFCVYLESLRASAVSAGLGKKPTFGDPADKSPKAASN